ncbi:7392_t:CDS:1, partial [Diversispora eburnea]
RIEDSWESYTASDGNSVQLPPKIIDMLKNDKFVPEPRNNFVTAFQNLQVSQSIILPNFGQKPKHFAEGYQGNTLFITQQMIDIWNTLSADQERSIKRVLSGPMGVGKSYISYFLASKAYAEGWLMLYIADANELNEREEEKAGEVICRYFIAQNKDILTAAELGQLVQYTNRYSVEVAATGEILGNLLKQVNRKTLFIVDEHGALFENEIVPNRLQILNPLMNLPYWGEHYKGVRVIFTGTAHAKYERTHMQNGQREWWIIYVGPLQDDVFDALLQMHPILKIPSIKEEVKKVTNCVPRELIHLAEYVNKLSITSIDVNTFKRVVKGFEDQRVDKILIIAQKYYNDIPKNEKNRYYAALTSMFVPSIPPVQFEWKFLDLGLIYRYKDNVIHYHPLCRSAQKALLKMYMSFDLPENIRNQLRIGELTGDQFEEALFNRFVCRSNTTTLLEATDLNNRPTSPVKIMFEDYAVIKNSGLSLGPGYDKVLGRGFNGYPRFDYMLGPMFIQVSISDFQAHNKAQSNIKNAFKRPMDRLSSISISQIGGRNQIEMYLDEMYGSGHIADIDLSTHRFVVTRNKQPVPGFCIVYIRGSPGTPNHSGKV